MNILDKTSPSGGTGGGSALVNCAPGSCGTPTGASSGSLTPSSGDCHHMANSQLIPSMAVASSSTAPSSVSSVSSAPHTPIDSLNQVSCQSDLTSNGLSARPNVSTPSSVFNSSAPNTPMPCPSPSVGGNINSPALNQLDYPNDAKLFNSGPPPQTLSNNGNNNGSNLLPSPMNSTPPIICNEPKGKQVNNGNGGNKKHCNSRNNQSNFGNINMACEPAVSKNQVNFSTPPMSYLPNGPHINGNLSPFDMDGKVCSYRGDFSPPIGDGMVMQGPAMSGIRVPNCSSGMPMQMQPNLRHSGPNKMGNNIPVSSNVSNKTPMDPQYMQQQSQVFVFDTMLANAAAEAVDNRQYENIIHYHLAQPNTKQFLDKHSMKIQNFNNPNPIWMNNIRHPRLRGPNPNGLNIRGNVNNQCFAPYNHPGPGPGGGPPYTIGPHWNANNSWLPQGPAPFPPGDMKMNCGLRPPGSQYNTGFNSNNSQPYPMGNDPQNDNLTPQQKQHRESKLAILANLQQKFCPELIESGNRLGPPHHPSNDFVNMDPLGVNQSNQHMFPDHMSIKHDNDLAMPPDINYNPSNFGQMGNSQIPPGDQWMNEKPFNGRRKGSQSANTSNLPPHQSPMSQHSVNSPNSCIVPSPSNRVPPPPPPYNQSLRPIPSPHPASPATVSLSMSSPRMVGSGENRPPNYTPGRSGPSTPSADGNCSMMPNNSPKSTGRTNSSPGIKKGKSNSVDSDINLLNSFKSESTAVAATLMPVPSPKQIDYINTFEGQELTIQKQPNAHFQENDLMVGNELHNEIFSSDFANNCPISNANAQICNYDMNSRYPPPDGMRFNGGMDAYRPPNLCNAQFNQGDPNMRFTSCDSSMKPRMPLPDMGQFPPSTMNDLNFNNSMPPIGDRPPFPSNGSTPNFNDPPDGAISSTHIQNLQKMSLPFDGASKEGLGPNSKPPMSMGSNQMMPPGTMHHMLPQPNAKSRAQNFDQPFTSMSSFNEMNDLNSFSEQNSHLKNMPLNYPNSFSNSPRMPSNLPTSDAQFGMHSNGPYGPMSQQMVESGPPGASNSVPMPPIPSSSQNNFRFMANSNRPPMSTPGNHTRYNSPNIQVKPDAPNTIQYLPSRPQGPTSTPPNRTPNLDFLQQSLNMSNKPPNGNPFFGNPPRGAMQPGANYPRMMTRPPNSHGAPPMGGPIDSFNRPPTGPPHNMSNGPNNLPPMSNYPPPGPSPTSLPPGQPPGKGPNPGSVIPPDNAAFNFKQSPFTPLPPNNSNDPAYAAQFHNFQQQLYATNTRNSNASQNPRMTNNY